MDRDQNIFYKLVNDENSTTELLCNLMRFASFRCAFLARLLPGTCFSDQIEHAVVDTQITLDSGNGRPDVVINDDRIYVLVEIKTDLYCTLTENQPDGYVSHLLGLTKDYEERWLVFLVPKGWIYENIIKNKFRHIKADSSSSRINTSILYWEDVLEIIEESDLKELNPFFNDFHEMLVSWYRPKPIKFTKEEVDMMFTNEIPNVLEKLDELIRQIYSKSRAYKCCQRHSGRDLCCEEKAIYFQNEKGEDIFYFGVWTTFWKDKGHPLCYGVKKDYTNVEAFRNVCKATNKDTVEFYDWIMSWVLQKTLSNENVADEIWLQLQPVLEDKDVGVAKVEI